MPESNLVRVSREMGPALRARCGPGDIRQETLAATWRDRDRHEWQGIAVHRAWLVAIARNRLRDEVRSASAGRRIGGAAAEEISLADSPTAGSRNASRAALVNERARIMPDARATLPPELEPIARLRLFEERATEDLAVADGIGVSAAWHRPRKGVPNDREAPHVLRTRRSTSDRRPA